MTIKARALGSAIPHVVWFASIAAAAFSPTALNAQTAAQKVPDTASTADRDSLEDIIITARKAAESQQSTPVAITVFSQRDLDRNNIQRPIDLQHNTPALQVAQSPSGQSAYTIRGQGQGFGTPPGVLLYFAGAPIDPGINGGQFGLFDLQSVQVLKGPQGTLFGRTSTGGAVLFDPQQPTGEFGGYLKGQVGSRDLNGLEGAINIPVFGDVLSIRVAGQYVRQQGYTRSFTTGQRLDNINNTGLRLGIRFKPTDWFSNYTLVEYNEVKSNTSSILTRGNTALYTPAFYTGTLNAVCGGAAALSGVPGNGAFVAGCVAQRQGLLADVQSAILASQARVAAGDIRQVGTSSTLNNVVRIYDVINQSTFNVPSFGPFSGVSLKNIFSTPLSRHVVQGFEVDGLPVKVGDFVSTANFVKGTCATTGATIGQCTQGGATAIPTTQPTTQFTEEINLSGRIFDRIDFLAGYFYSLSKNNKLLPSAGFSAFQNVFDPFLSATANTGYQTYAEKSEKGTFVQATLDMHGIIDGLRLTGGYRWNSNYSTTTSSTTLNGTPTTTTLNQTGYNYTLSADWKIRSDLLIYLRRSRAFKPGGANPVTCLQNVPPCPLTFGPEVVQDLEFGAKWDWRLGDLRGRTNVAAYMTDDSSIQRRYAGSVTGLNYLLNAAQAKIKGIEFDQILLYRGLSLDAHVSYIDAYYTRWFAQQLPTFPCSDPQANSGNNCADYSDSAFTGTPKYQVSVNLRYTLPFDQKVGDITPSISFYRQADVNYADVPHTDPGAVEPAYSLWNARIDWNAVMGSRFSASLFVRNLTDKVYANARNSVFPTLGIQTASYAEPRTVGFELKYSFGQ